MRQTLLVLLLLVQLLSSPGRDADKRSEARTEPSSSALSRDSNDLTLLELGTGSRLRQHATPPTEIKLVSYNIRWRSGDDLKELIKLFRDDPEIGNAAILGLQEVDRRKKRSGNTNTAKLMAEELGLHYAWTAPPTAKPGDEEETGVAILSVYPLSDVRRLVLPHEGPDRRRRVALGASVKIENVDCRVYSAHLETRIPLDKKLEQMNALLQDLAQFPKMRAIVLGDLNTWEAGAGRKTIKFFTDAGFRSPFGSQPTFSRRYLFVPIKLELDWIWLRGLEIASFGIARKIEVSDHWPLWTNIRLPKPGN